MVLSKLQKMLKALENNRDQLHLEVRMELDNMAEAASRALANDDYLEMLEIRVSASKLENFRLTLDDVEEKINLLKHVAE